MSIPRVCLHQHQVNKRSMLRDIFRSFAGFGNLGVISTLIFVIFFIFLVMNVIYMKKKMADDYGNIPFDDGSKKTEDFQDN